MSSEGEDDDSDMDDLVQLASATTINTSEDEYLILRDASETGGRILHAMCEHGISDEACHDVAAFLEHSVQRYTRYLTLITFEPEFNWLQSMMMNVVSAMRNRNGFEDHASSSMRPDMTMSLLHAVCETDAAMLDVVHGPRQTDDCANNRDEQQLSLPTVQNGFN